MQLMLFSKRPSFSVSFSEGEEGEGEVDVCDDGEDCDGVGDEGAGGGDLTSI